MPRSTTGSQKYGSQRSDVQPPSQSAGTDQPDSGRSTVGIRDLRADVAALVRRAGAGEHVVISVAGRPVAHLGPLRSVDGQVQLVDLVAGGRVIGPRRSGPYSAPDPVPVWQGSRIDRLLQEIR